MSQRTIRVPATIHFSPEELERVDATAKLLGKSRSAWAKEVLAAAVASVMAAQATEEQK